MPKLLAIANGLDVAYFPPNSIANDLDVGSWLRNRHQVPVWFWSSIEDRSDGGVFDKSTGLTNTPCADV